MSVLRRVHVNPAVSVTLETVGDTEPDESITSPINLFVPVVVMLIVPGFVAVTEIELAPSIDKATAADGVSETSFEVAVAATLSVTTFL